VSPRAVTAPIAPNTARAKNPSINHDTPGLQCKRSGSPRHAHQLVAQSPASNKNVLSRWTIIEIARSGDALSATNPNTTRPAPSSASVNVNTSTHPLAHRKRLPRGYRRHARTTSDSQQQYQSTGDAMRKRNQRFNLGGTRQDLPITQCPMYPTACPDPVARTYAPTK